MKSSMNNHDRNTLPIVVNQRVPILQFDSVSKSYEENVVVDELSFSLSPGEFVAILGPNGAGKTTLLEMSVGLRRPTSGLIRIFNHAAHRLRCPEKRRLGIVLQSQGFPTLLTVDEYLHMIAAAYQIPRIESELLESLNIDKILGKRIGDLSGGQIRRIAIFAAIFPKPELLVLDEPTSSLDPSTRLVVWRELRKMCRDMKRPCAVILSSHDMHEAAELSDEVLIIRQGRLCTRGSPSELIAMHGHKGKVRIPIRNEVKFRYRFNALPEDLVPEIVAHYPNEGACAIFDQCQLSALLKTPVVEDLDLDRLSTQKATLEDVFVRLTCGENT